MNPQAELIRTYLRSDHHEFDDRIMEELDLENWLDGDGGCEQAVVSRAQDALAAASSAMFRAERDA